MYSRGGSQSRKVLSRPVKSWAFDRERDPAVVFTLGSLKDIKHTCRFAENPAPPLLSGSMSGSFRFDDRRPVIRGNWRGITLIRPLYKPHIHYSQFGNSKIKIL